MVLRGPRRPARCADGSRPGVALALFFLALPVFTFVLAPLSSLYSRRHEFEADAFAAQHASAAALVQALVKLYEDNASTLTPDPLHSAFYDSHPPAAIRIARLEAASLNGRRDERTARRSFSPHRAAQCCDVGARRAQPAGARRAATPTPGEALHAKDCVACHVAALAATETRCTRAPTARSRRRTSCWRRSACCNAELATGYFPEEEEHVAAYLNLQYYKFKP